MTSDIAQPIPASRVACFQPIRTDQYEERGLITTVGALRNHEEAKDYTFELVSTNIMGWNPFNAVVRYFHDQNDQLWGYALAELPLTHEPKEEQQQPDPTHIIDFTESPHVAPSTGTPQPADNDRYQLGRIHAFQDLLTWLNAETQEADRLAHRTDHEFTFIKTSSTRLAYLDVIDHIHELATKKGRP